MGCKNKVGFGFVERTLGEAGSLLNISWVYNLSYAFVSASPLSLDPELEEDVSEESESESESESEDPELEEDCDSCEELDPDPDVESEESDDSDVLESCSGASAGVSPGT